MVKKMGGSLRSKTELTPESPKALTPSSRHFLLDSVTSSVLKKVNFFSRGGDS